MRLSELTTLRLGGPAERYLEANTEEEVVDAVREDGPLLILAGGSNVVVADEGFAGTVLRIATRGVAREGTMLEVAAGEDWDALVASCVAEGLAGVECLAGIPGSVGATPIQNVGAYGQEVAETIVAVRVLDRIRGSVEELPPAACRRSRSRPRRAATGSPTAARCARRRSSPRRRPRCAPRSGASTSASAD